jgi:ketosteroid isomerase-like protein
MAARNEVLQADMAFSELSATHGQQDAFMKYMADKGVLLRPHHNPMKESMVRLYIQMMDTSKSSLTWQPAGADVSASGDLGYTFGIYTYRVKDSVQQGTYVTIWKRDPDGKWKAVLDTGNPGLAKTP